MRASTRLQTSGSSPSSSVMCSRVIAPRVATTWPWGSEREMLKPSKSPRRTTSTGPSDFRTARNASTLSIGQSDRFATVRLVIFPPARDDSRRRIAGGELRLGTTSMYMGEVFAVPNEIKSIYLYLHGYILTQELSAFSGLRLFAG